MWDLRAENESRKKHRNYLGIPDLAPFFRQLASGVRPGLHKAVVPEKGPTRQPHQFPEFLFHAFVFSLNFFPPQTLMLQVFGYTFSMNFPMMSVYPRFNIQNTAPRISHFWGAVLASVPGHMRLRHVTNHLLQASPCTSILFFRQAGDLDRCPQVFHLKVRIRTLSSRRSRGLPVLLLPASVAPLTRRTLNLALVPLSKTLCGKMPPTTRVDQAWLGADQCIETRTCSFLPPTDVRNTNTSTSSVSRASWVRSWR